MKISTRNTWQGTVIAITHGTIVSEVTLEIAPDVIVTSIVSRKSIDELKLQIGSPAYALVKSTEVILAVD
jgi:molybdate transport system regulatory protein